MINPNKGFNPIEQHYTDLLVLGTLATTGAVLVLVGAASIAKIVREAVTQRYMADPVAIEER